MSEAAAASRKKTIDQKLSGRLTFGICAGLLILFGLLSFTATLHKSATYDEPIHVLGGFMHRYFHDYRINFEDPALFGFWAALPQSDLHLAVDVREPSFELAATNPSAQWIFAVETLYHSKFNDPDSFLAVSRSMFTFLGIGLGALLAWWSWRLAGVVAALVATVLFAFDPNITAHASLVKNDIGLGLLLLGLGYSIWQLGRRGGVLRVLLVALICGAALNLKFSGVLFAPIAAILLISRAVMDFPWTIAAIRLRKVGQRLAAVAATLLLIAVMSWGTTWASYGFRYAPLRDGELLNADVMQRLIQIKELSAMYARTMVHPRPPTLQEVDAHEIGAIPRFIRWIERKHYLPQGWTYGFLYTYATTLVRSSFLLGENRIIGWWYYFPAAMLFKTAVITLLAALGALVLGIVRFASAQYWERRAADHMPDPRVTGQVDLWTLLCLSVPPVVYALAAMTSNLNLGLRHILPVYPYIYIGIALCCATAVRWWGRNALLAMAAAALLLIAESLPWYPDYIPFFNVPSRIAGPLNLLGDSNLDWGQDLRLVADWQKTHKDRPLYFSYFGIADPSHYGIDYTNLIGGYPFRPFNHLPPRSQNAYIALSATNLQAIYISAQDDEFAEFRTKYKPIAVLGHSIYIYEWPPK